jgi:hypothetical protein
MDPILLSDTFDEEDMSQQTKRRGIAKKRNAEELVPNVFSEKEVDDAPSKKPIRGSLHKNTIGQLPCDSDDDESAYQDSNASEIL